MNTLILDLETTVKEYNKRKASSFCPDNWVVASGYRHQNDPPFINYFADPLGWRYHCVPIRQNTNVLVGFNIKFDLLYMWEKPEVKSFFKRGGRIWDCQYVHYLLHGMQQSVHMASMDSVVEQYGGQLKIDEVKALWEEGIDTPHIDETLLCDYLEGDIKNTRIIFEKQFELVKRQHPNMLQMIWNRMDGLLATTEMEYNGLTIDEETGREDRDRLHTEYERLHGCLDLQLPELPEELTFNWNSTYHRSALLFGGTIKYRKWKPKLSELGEQLYATKIEKEPIYIKDPISGAEIQARYKSGQKKGDLKFKNIKVPDLTKPKGRLEDEYYTFKKQATPKDEWETLQRDPAGNYIYSTNHEVVAFLGAMYKANPLFKTLAEAQKLGKDLSTYYWSEDKNGNKKGMLTLVGADGRIHHKLNHTSTVTGRLSSSDPNMQNIPRGDKSLAKRMFVSRFGSDGRIIEIDYSQLEVIVQGVLSKDTQLCRDIRAGVDFHVKRLSAATGESYDDLKRRHLAGDESVSAERTRIKGFTFQRAYGAGPQAISASTGMSEERVRELIRAEELLYPGVSRFDKEVEDSIRSTAVHSEHYVTINSISLKPQSGHWFSPTGTKYVWTQKEAPHFLKDQGTYVSFSPTERKNWPVQGLGGEIVQTMIGKLFRFFAKQNNYNERAFLINTVHDCVLIDCHEDMVEKVTHEAKQIMEKVPNVFNYYFDMKINVPFPVEAEVGLNWYDMEHFNEMSPFL